MPAKFSRVPKYTAPDGTQFDSLVDEQKYELKLLLCAANSPSDGELSAITMMVNERDKVLAILRQSERKHASPAKPRRRKVSQPIAAEA